MIRFNLWVLLLLRNLNSNWQRRNYWSSISKKKRLRNRDNLKLYRKKSKWVLISLRKKMKRFRKWKRKLKWSICCFSRKLKDWLCRRKIKILREWKFTCTGWSSLRKTNTRPGCLISSKMENLWNSRKHKQCRNLVFLRLITSQNLDYRFLK